MTVLAIDTATEVLSVSLIVDDQVFTTVRDVGLKHTGILMPIVAATLNAAGVRVGDLDLVACSQGPGSFTGLRIGMATAKGLAEAVATARDSTVPPLVAIPTLAAMAAAAADLFAVLPVIDGKKSRYYSSLFRSGRCLIDNMDLPSQCIVRCAQKKIGESEPLLVTGPHAERFIDEIMAADTQNVTARLVLDPRCRGGWSAQIARMGWERFTKAGAASRDLGPTYVRGSDAELSRRPSTNAQTTAKY